MLLEDNFWVAFRADKTILRIDTVKETLYNERVILLKEREGMGLKVCFRGAEELKQGIAYVAEDLGIDIVTAADAQITVTVEKANACVLSASLDGKEASITYGGGKARFFRGLAMLVSWVKDGEQAKSVTEHPLFTTNGPMLQETAVMRVQTVKTIFRKMALMGLGSCLFYTEDTYEIKDRPYFGYMRGRYTHEELKELDAYAAALGIELIPCIQTLGHLATHLRWQAATPYKDTESCLLAGEEQTYRLIDDMLKTVKECFRTRRVHLGMDETKDLGTGAYLKKNGYKERQDIYFEHLEKVKQMTLSYGLEPMMWSDMFFRLAGRDLESYKEYDMRVRFTDEVKKKTPKGVRQVFWDYYKDYEEFYAFNIDQHRGLFDDDPIFAGGIWCWSGMCPLYSLSLRNTRAALNACKEKGLKEIFATIWGGSEHSLVLALAGLAWYADYDYKGTFDLESIKECLRFSCGVSYDDLMLFELPEHPDGGVNGVTRALLHNDPLTGLSDKHIAMVPMREYYKKTTEQLRAAAKDKGIFAPALDVIVKVSSLFENKADFGVRLKAAYDKGDREALRAMIDECDVIIEKIDALRQSHRAAWMTYNKPFLWDIYEGYYGGSMARFDTVKWRVGAYLAGEIDRIEELEEERLRLDGLADEGAEPFTGKFKWMAPDYYAHAR